MVRFHLGGARAAGRPRTPIVRVPGESLDINTSVHALRAPAYGDVAVAFIGRNKESSFHRPFSDSSIRSPDLDRVDDNGRSQPSALTGPASRASPYSETEMPFRRFLCRAQDQDSINTVPKRDQCVMIARTYI
ncbi:hypothetical protein EVAR_68101_1 [Eumeta japonica]|uniref:Uncharacterized protein n=1 Tax=Eumeta variegata TaxID=151549 RepID=A0A4C2A9P5_EUMVA|nr:hypothetical protein EVAR_68101_1 [Eumeta japonica]